MFGKKSKTEREPDAATGKGAAAQHPSRLGLGGDTLIKDWLAHPQGGPVLRAYLVQSGSHESQLDPVQGFAMKRLIPMTEGQFTEEVIAQLVVKAEGYEPPETPTEDGIGVTSGRFGGHTVIVTGAGTGIGRATALRIAQEGGRVIAVDSKAQSLDALVAEHTRGEIVTVVAEGDDDQSLGRVLRAASTQSSDVD